jgi:demethylmenaquinone methyltransferase/2-methoxy-6-polyprenyl-1,4-benzoquinol methylase|tara:strand:+ start:2230 stop:2934 length:705 start_codon:yes stop_codon:yes gene_type:complete
MRQNLQQTKGLVENVFNKVFDKYDLMNDIMSIGLHRLWKKEFVKMMNPGPKQKLIDVACGTGDIAKIYSNLIKNKSEIYCVDPNKNMVQKGKKKLKKYKNIRWKINSAENLYFRNNFFDFYTISFGLRNTKNLEKSLSEAYRVLKNGGRFLCLEFSKIENRELENIYKTYAKIIPVIGGIIVGDTKPYEYLTKSIEEFANQDELLDLMKKNNFVNCEYRNLSGGVVAIHSGWKV